MNLLRSSFPGLALCPEKPLFMIISPEARPETEMYGRIAPH